MGPTGPAGASLDIAASTTSDTMYLTNACANYSGGTVTINATGPGWVMVDATAWVRFEHTTGTTDQLILGIGTNATDCSTATDQIRWEIPGAYPTDADINHSLRVSSWFFVSSAASYTYYLNANMVSGASAQDRLWYGSMRAMYSPL
jgi:hypothetical protein